MADLYFDAPQKKLPSWAESFEGRVDFATKTGGAASSPRLDKPGKYWRSRPGVPLTPVKIGNKSFLQYPGLDVQSNGALVLLPLNEAQPAPTPRQLAFYQATGVQAIPTVIQHLLPIEDAPNVNFPWAPGVGDGSNGKGSATENFNETAPAPFAGLAPNEAWASFFMQPTRAVNLDEWDKVKNVGAGSTAGGSGSGTSVDKVLSELARLRKDLGLPV